MNKKSLPAALLFSFLTFFLISCHIEAIDERIKVDLILEADHIVTMNQSNLILKDSAIAIDEGLIIDIDSIEVISNKYEANEHILGNERIVLPGLINGHSHAAMTLLRGIADDLALIDWLNNYIFPVEAEFVDAEFVRVGTELACWEMIRGGTTTFVDMYYYPDSIAKVVESCGLRALIATTVINQASPDAKNAEDSIEKGKRFVKRWKSNNSRINPIFGPHANYSLTIDQLKATRNIANELGVTISMHVSESPFEVNFSKENYGMTSIDFLESINFFNAPTIAAHVVWPSKNEIKTLARKKVGVIHNPTSNMKIASGIAPISDMLDAGIKIGLGTDGAASNNDLDMWEEMRLAAFLQKINKMNPQVLPANTVLTMATRGGAEAIGLQNEIGSLEIGMKADLIQVNFNDPHHIPTYDIISHLVYVTDEQDVVSVIVDGKVLMREGNILSIDKDRVKQEANQFSKRIRSSLKTSLRNL